VQPVIDLVDLPSQIVELKRAHGHVRIKRRRVAILIVRRPAESKENIDGTGLAP
jgi:hypothetical protein